jgi:hypothetical protein
LRRDIAVIKKEIQELTTQLEDPVPLEADPVQQNNDRYRLKGQTLHAIKAELRALPGWYKFKKELDRSMPGGSGEYLDAVASHVQAGTLPVERGFWFRNSSTSSQESQNEASTPESSPPAGDPQPPKSRREVELEAARREREAKYFDADDAHAQRQLQDDIYGFERPDEAGPTKRQLKHRRAITSANLPANDENGYDSDNKDNRSGKMPSGEEQPKNSADQDPWRHIDTDLGDDLKDILAGRKPDSEQSTVIAENDTESYYGVPSSPLKTEAPQPSPSTEVEAPRTAQTNFDRAPQPLAGQNGEAQLQPMNRGERRESIENDYQFEIGGVTFQNGEKVTYTEADGDKAPHMIIQKVGENPARLRLLNLESGTEFAIDENSISRIEKLQDGEGSGDPVEGGPRDREGGEQFERENYIDGVPKVPTALEVIALAEGARLNVDAQIQAVAQAKEQREKFFGRNKRDQAALEQANGSLENAYGQYMDNWAAVLADYRGIEDNINEYKADMQEKMTIHDAVLARLAADTQLPPELKQSRIEQRQERIIEARMAIQKCDEQIETLHRNVAEAENRIQVEMIVEMAQTRSKVEAAQCALKVGTKSEKFRTFWRSKNGRRTRLAVGAALGIAGAAIAMTGVGAGVGSAMVAGAGAVMRGTGGFMATEAGVNMLHNRRADKGDERTRTASWDAQTGNTQLEAIDDANYITENGEALGAGRMSEADLAAFMQANAGALYSEGVLKGALAGRAESSAAVADLLLKTQLDRVQSDAKSNRRAKRGAAVVGVAAAAAPFVLRHFFDGPPKGPKPPGPEDPTPPKPYSPDEARMKGILSTDEAASQNWENMSDNYQGLSPAEKAMYTAAEQAYDKNYGGALRGLNLSTAELDRLNFILGRGSVDIGNEQMAQVTRNIAQQVQRGVPTEKILQLYGMPTDGLPGTT